MFDETFMHRIISIWLTMRVWLFSALTFSNCLLWRKILIYDVTKNGFFIKQNTIFFSGLKLLLFFCFPFMMFFLFIIQCFAWTLKSFDAYIYLWEYGGEAPGRDGSFFFPSLLKMQKCSYTGSLFAADLIYGGRKCASSNLIPLNIPVNIPLK